MFSFFANKKHVDISRYIGRICDLTAPKPTFDNERSENRYNRSIPVLVCPWNGNGNVMVDRCMYAMTKDLSDHGLALILNHPMQSGEAVIGIWLPHDVMDHPWFFRATLHPASSIGGGFWQIGVELHEFMNDDYRIELQALSQVANDLLPIAD